MTMAEFNIRLFSFNRMRNFDELMFREVAYYSMIGAHLNPKKLPKDKQTFWKIGQESNNKEKIREAMIKAMEDYKKNKSNV